jgi:hypothetical protein
MGLLECGRPASAIQSQNTAASNKVGMVGIHTLSLLILFISRPLKHKTSPPSPLEVETERIMGGPPKRWARQTS